ncbi:unnamed protein product [Rotaria sp. Silwood2]|nr:unnamed protein product [Rotaria sp. Silwood2]
MIATQSPFIDLSTHGGNNITLQCIVNCSTAGGYVGNEPLIVGPCTDFSTALDLTVSQRSDMINLTVPSYFIVAYTSLTNAWQTLALGNSVGWSLASTIDLRIRSDNGLINTPPVATCISYISIPVGITQTIQIPVLDADNDFIRCRFANGSSECCNTCPPGSLPSGTSLSSSCTLTITGSLAGNALVQNTTNSSLWSLTITWQPTATQVGTQVFCAIASDSASVQSDQYCVTFSVGLTSVPLCPGVTVTTTLTTTYTSINTSSTTAMTSVIPSSVEST